MTRIHRGRPRAAGTVECGPPAASSLPRLTWNALTRPPARPRACPGGPSLRLRRPPGAAATRQEAFPGSAPGRESTYPRAPNNSPQRDVTHSRIASLRAKARAARRPAERAHWVDPRVKGAIDEERRGRVDRFSRAALRTYPRDSSDVLDEKHDNVLANHTRGGLHGASGSDRGHQTFGEATGLAERRRGGKCCAARPPLSKSSAPQRPAVPRASLVTMPAC